MRLARSAFNGNQDGQDRLQRDVLTLADAFEVFDPEIGDHWRGLSTAKDFRIDGGGGGADGVS